MQMNFDVFRVDTCTLIGQVSYKVLNQIRKLLRQRILKINSNLLSESKMLQFKINSNNQELEKKLNIGLFRLDDYLAFYMNLTAYKEYVDCRGSTINFNFFYWFSIKSESIF